MPLFEKRAWPAYKSALRRIAESGMELEMTQAAGIPNGEAAEQQFQEALSDYQQARAGLVDPLAYMAGALETGPDGEADDWSTSDGYPEILQQGDGPGTLDPQQG